MSTAGMPVLAPVDGPPSALAAPIDGLPSALAAPGARVCVLGLGHVGLPLAVALAESGARVTGIDVAAPVVDGLQAGRSHLGDVADDRLRSVLDPEGGPGSLRATTGADALLSCDAAVICVPTPLRGRREPDLSLVVEAARRVAERARQGQLVVLESTTWPGTTQEVIVPLLRAQGLEPGEDVAVAFSPERVDPGCPGHDLRRTPKVVGGVTARCAAAARALYERTCERVVEVGSATTAEMVKLLENTFRSVNIALANEMAVLCRAMGLDVWEVVEAAATKPYGFMSFRPGPGTGGHCIPVDPLYLAWKARRHGVPARLAELAAEINEAMPAHVVRVLEEALQERGRPLSGARVLVAGVAYKSDVADVRESPGLALLRLLRRRGARVAFHDSLVPRVVVEGETLTGVALTPEEAGDLDAAVIATVHSADDVGRLVRLAPLVVDTRNATATLLAEAPGLAERVRRL